MEGVNLFDTNRQTMVIHKKIMDPNIIITKSQVLRDGRVFQAAGVKADESEGLFFLSCQLSLTFCLLIISFSPFFFFFPSRDLRTSLN